MCEHINEKSVIRDNPWLRLPTPVLDKGFVRLVDWMGDNTSPAMAARVSFGSGTKGEQQDKNLTDYLLRHHHTSPFEMVEFMFHIKLPLFVFAQLVRHRTANVNSKSARYSKMTKDFYIPDTLRKRDYQNKQGSTGHVENEEELLKLLEKTTLDAYDTYETLLKAGVAREMARMVLPQNLYTEVYWKQDLHNLLHLLNLRLDDSAQWEIRQYALVIYDVVKYVVPWAIESWENHVNKAISLSATEQELLSQATTIDKEKLEMALNTMVDQRQLPTGFAREIKSKFRVLYE